MLLADGADNDAAPRAVRKSVEQPVHFGFRKLIYNHLVVDYPPPGTRVKDFGRDI